MQIKIKVQGVGTSGTRTDINTGAKGQFRLVSDEPPERGGKNEGMLPLEAFLAGYVACTNVIANHIAHELGISFRDLVFRATGYLDPRGYLGEQVLTTPFTKVELAVEGKTGASLSQLDELKEQLSWRCPAAATLRSSGTVIEDTWDMTAL